MSRTSEYTLELQIKDDKSKDAIRELEKGLKHVGETVKKDATGNELTNNLEESQKAAQAIIDRFHEMAKNPELDFQTVSKAYSKNAGKAIAELEKQYATIKETQEIILEQEKKLNDLKASRADQSELIEAHIKLAKLYEENKISSIAELDAKIKQNRQIRANLKAANQSAMLERAYVKDKKLEELLAKRNAATNRSEQKSLDEKIKQQKALIKSIQQAEQACVKQQEAVTKAIEKSTKSESWFAKSIQTAYNVTGMVGGAVRTAKAVAGAGIGIAKQIGAGVSAVASGADQEVERERQANRIKGYDNPDERVGILRQIYVRTGADYSTIVDAIGRVQSILGKSLSKDELVSAAAIELRYPGMSQAFASTTTKADPVQYQRYANRMKAIQHATGASDEQIQASTQMMANMKTSDFGSASITELQTIYLGLQNSGAFDSQDELDKAFRGFVRKQRDSKKNVFEFAQDYDWNRYISGDNNRIQAQNTLHNMDWGSIGAALNKTDDTKAPEMSRAETMAMKMREIEDKKNQLLMKLIPAVLPVVEGIAHLMETKGDKIVKGLMALFETVIPLLEPVFDALDAFLGFMSRTILPGFQKLIQSVLFWLEYDDQEFKARQTQRQIDAAKSGSTAAIIASRSGSDHVMGFSNGGVASFPSICGEQGPEAIIPLDYSRAQRAENIANTVNQTFNMGNNQTTALSLAQAVRSRDFTRAMTDNQFFTRRCGAF
ncbi:MAG: hypothetical protein IIY06_05035 [Proteobacteria bacterium]|nr:hypothetical protein [Pseudomonadota bacterium]